MYSEDGKRVLVEASVSDDFDTPGMGTAMVTCGGTPTLESVRQAIYRAWDEANDDQKGNRQYAGFSILRNTIRYAVYSGGKPQGKGRRGTSWVETLILPAGDVEMIGAPPGDNYHKWGFQGEESIPTKHKDAMESWANKRISGQRKGKSFKSGKWTIKPWSDQ